MTTNAPPTVRTRKLLFINSQTTLLSHPLLSPSHSWVTANNGAARASADTHGVHIPQRVVEDVLGALKLLLAKHCRRAYPPQASRNVAEQIESLFMREGRGEDGEPAAVGREVDLVDDEAIAALPPTWPSEHEATSYPMEAQRYAEGVSHLTQLSDQRAQLRRRVAALRRIQMVVEPLAPVAGGEASDESEKQDERRGTDGLQENLVTRNGAVERELEKTRILLARVAGRVASLPLPADGEDDGEDEGRRGNTGTRGVAEFLANARVFPE